MTSWVLLTGLLATTPPLVSADPEPPPPGPFTQQPPPPGPFTQQPPQAVLTPRPPRRTFAVTPRPSLTPEAPAKVGVSFAPVSLFGLALFAEVDVALVGGLDVFAVIGGGIAGQLGFEAGLRYYALGRPMEGFYVDARASGFSLPSASFVMMSPGVQLGHAWRIRAFTISLGAGFSTWWTINRGTPTSFLFGSPSESDFIAFPGLQLPSGGGPTVQPTLRVAIGFAL